MLVAIGSAKGSPGSTTTAVGLAGAWPEPDVVVVECDPAGGDIAARFGVPVTPGLMELAATCSAAASTDLLSPERFVHWIDTTDAVIRVVPAPVGFSPASTAVTALCGNVARLSGLAETVILDIGRITPSSPSWPLAEAADLIVVVARGVTEQAAHLKGLLPALPRPAAIAVVPDRFTASDIAAVLDANAQPVISMDLPVDAAMSRRRPAMASRRARTRITKAWSAAASTMTHTPIHSEGATR